MATAVSTNKAQALLEIEQAFGRVPHWIEIMPEGVFLGFWTQMRDFYFAETAIPVKYKELIGLAVSGATRCKYCALFHTEGARLAGATDEEIAEASAMGALSMEGSTFLNAMQIDYDEFKKETLEIVRFVREQQAKKAAAAPKQGQREQRA